MLHTIAHILQGLIIASDNIDEVVRIIRAAKSPQEAISNLMSRFALDEIQAKAIVEMRLRQLTGLEQDKLRAEYQELQKLIECMALSEKVDYIEQGSHHNKRLNEFLEKNGYRKAVYRRYLNGKE